MKAFVLRSYGSPDVLELTDVPRPAPGPGEVLVRVRAVSVQPADWHLMRGEPRIARLMGGPLGPRRPRIAVLGSDLAGEVVSAGAGVTGFAPGDEVYAMLLGGAFAEYAAVPAAELARKPANLTFEQAAAVPLAACTAMVALRDRVRPGRRVLVIGASGGVGTFAVQIAKAFGAEVTGVCSARNAELVRSIGADHIVDYTKEDFAGAGRRYDLILDLVGNRSLADFRRALTPTGTLVLSSGNGSRVFGPMGRLLRANLIFPFVRQRLRAPIASPKRERLDDLRELIEAGKVTPAIDRTYPLAQTAAAVRYFMEEHARAKVVITV